VQLAAALQVTPHACPLHVIGCVHDCEPVHVTVVVEASLVIGPAHDVAPRQCTLQD
jgi:hypothetical protein